MEVPFLSLPAQYSTLKKNQNGMQGFASWGSNVFAVAPNSFDKRERIYW
jgi:hypothetical protein